MTVDELDGLIAELRQFGTDHQAMEAKSARTALPDSTHETLSAFANSGGGTVLLGVSEQNGTFAVTGVDDVKKSQSDLQALCAQMAPPLRATIDLVDHPDGRVVVARIPAIPRQQRPCHLASLSAEASSYVRVGDGDQKLTSDEARYMLADQASIDYSSTTVESIRFDGSVLPKLLASVRQTNTRNAKLGNDALLRRWGVVNERGHCTLAGALCIGDNPQAALPTARVTYRVLPRGTDPTGTRYSGKHAEGTIGELLDDVIAFLRADLGQVQAVRNGGLYDVPPIPLESLREMLSNALIHRSFAPGLRDRPVVVEVSDDAVAVTSPGNLYTSTDPDLLGLSPMAGVRNITLVRICEHLSTPSGARVVENQTSGITASDIACHHAGVMPALFVDRPDSFQVLLIRGVVDTRTHRSAVRRASLAAPDTAVRLLAVASRLEELRDEFPELGGTALDAALAARSLAPCSLEDASGHLLRLEEAGLLRRLAMGRRPIWAPSPAPDIGGPAAKAPSARAQAPSAPTSASIKGSRTGRIPDLLAAIGSAEGGVLGAAEIGGALGLSSPTSRNRWISRAKNAGLITPTKENPFDPTGGYTLTRKGQRMWKSNR